ncbi:hypothetical protein [Celeribacter sp. PS-C1]|uniref:hypothetical protein n=1 Tax=Celeribacter sp. PS-C1 TaxID=2820813 RepID=UPI001CA4C963|nr:hypothetical protein [Celeribacter sp. PS-C1]MBW6419648.1 hypothetical protein [Celeribacter sp. PS-C1]
MEENKMSPLRDAILQALALKEAAREALDEISAHPDCDPILRRQTYELDRAIDQNTFHSEHAIYEMQRILCQANEWIKAGEEKVLIWDEGCPHAGWIETVLQDDLAILDHKCKALRELLRVVTTIVNMVAADLIEEKLYGA